MKRAFEKKEPVTTTTEPVGNKASTSAAKLATNCDELVGIKPVIVCHHFKKTGNERKLKQKRKENEPVKICCSILAKIEK